MAEEGGVRGEEVGVDVAYVADGEGGWGEFGD